MIYILAGMAKSGKSLVSKTILKTKQIQVISTDWIMMMLFHGNKDLNLDINRSDISVSRQLEPYIEGLIESLSVSKKDFLIEGVHIQPEFGKKLSERFPNKLRAVYLGYKDLDPKVKASELRAHVESIDNPWYRHMGETELLKLTKYLQKESEKLYQSCQTHQQTYIEVQNILEDELEILKILFGQ